MNIKAIFHGKDPELELKNCVFERVVFLPDEKYQQFQKNLLEEYDFISMYRDEMYRTGDTVHCILVKGMNSSDGVLVNSEGFGYARYTAYLPAAQAFLNEQKMLEGQETTPEPVRREISQEELANAVGVTRQTITSIEVEKYVASLPLAYKIAHYFGLAIEEVFDFSDVEGM